MVEIELHPELEARYAELAVQSGIPLAQYIAERLQALEPSAKPLSAKLEMTPEERVADVDAWLERLRRYSHKIPALPESAFTRESFYQDHD